MLLKQQPIYSKNNGFTLVEVLVGLLVITGFISTAMQALVTATVFKVKGQELSEATTWIQEDLEMVKFKASRLHYTVTDPSKNEGSYEPDDVACKGSKDTGYASVLKEDLEAVDEAKKSAIGNRPYTLTRDVLLPTTAPYNVLTLEYEVASADDIPIAVTHATVIPDASLACP